MSGGKVAPSDAPGGRGSFSMPSGGDLPSLWGRATSCSLGTTEVECTDTFPGRTSPVLAQARHGPGRYLGPSLSSGGGSGRSISAVRRGASFNGLASITRASSLRRGVPFGRPSVLDVALMPLRRITVQSSSGEDNIAALQRAQQPQPSEAVNRFSWVSESVHS